MFRLKSFIEGCVLQYLNRKLDDRRHQVVYKLSNWWGQHKGLGRITAFYCASADIQKRLIEEFSYYECPSCLWAVPFRGKHLLDQSSYCAEIQEKQKRGDFFW